LPQPAEVPLRHMVRERLCEFGSDRQQGAILFFTISGLAAMLDNRYDEAVYYMDAANRIDVSCFQLPALPARPADESGDKPLPPREPAPPPQEAAPQ
jgi:sigma54-dependent transcription regulator